MSSATYETCPDHSACVRVTDGDSVRHEPARKGGTRPDTSFLAAVDKAAQADALTQRIETATQAAEDRLVAVGGDLDVVLAQADQAAERIEAAGSALTTALTDARGVLLSAREAETRMREMQDSLNARIEYAEEEMREAVIQRQRQATVAFGQLVEARRGVERELADLERSIERVGRG